MSLRRLRGDHVASCLLALCIVVGLLSPPVAATTTTTPQLTSAGPLRINLPQPLVGCDPVGQSLPASTMQVLSLVLPSAYTTNAHGVVQQADSFLVQAEVQSLSPLVVAYTLRKGASWADGTPISILDFVSTWHDGASGTGPAADQYRLVKSITSAPGSQNVVVTFKHPTSAWQALFSPLMPALASPSAEANCQAPSPAVDISGGPYSIVTSSTQSVSLARNPSWWGNPPLFSTVTAVGSQPLNAASDASATDLTMSQASWLSQSALATVTSNPTVSSGLTSSNRLLSLDFAVRGSGALSQTLRLGLAGLLNRDAVRQSTANLIDPATQTASSHLYTQGLPNYPDSSVVPTLNSVTTTTTTLPVSSSSSTTPSSTPASTTTTTSPFHAATSLLIKAGYHVSNWQWVSAKNQPLALTMAVPTDDQWALEAAANVASQLRSQGVTVSILEAPGSFEVAQMLQYGQCSLGIIVRTTDGLPAHAATWFSLAKGVPASPLWAGFSDRQINRLAASALEQMNAQDAAPTYAAIDQRLWQLMPSLPLFTEPTGLVWTSSIDGVVLDPYPLGTLTAINTWKLLTPSP